MLTFEPHPREHFRPDDPPFRLTLQAERRAALAALGVQVVYELPFDDAFSALTAEEFVGGVLHDGIGAAHLTCGPDFAFGHRRGGDVAFLAARAEALGIGLTVAPPLLEGGAPVSSSRIRRLLQDGYPERAAQALGRPWAVRGPVTHGDARGRTIGFPTANVPLGRHLEPARGVYAVVARLPDGTQVPGVANIGRRPTVAEGADQPGGGAPVRLGRRPVRAGGGGGAARLPAGGAEVRVVRRAAGQIVADAAQARGMLGVR